MSLGDSSNEEIQVDKNFMLQVILWELVGMNLHMDQVNRQMERMTSLVDNASANMKNKYSKDYLVVRFYA